MKIVALNKAGEQMMTANPAEMIGKSIIDILFTGQQGHKKPNLDIYQQFFTDFQPYSYIRTQLDPKGRKTTVQASGRPIVCDDGTVFLCESMRVLLAADDRRGNDMNKLNMIGQSPACLRLLDQLQKAARCDAPVLLYGETGSGKEMAANYLHTLSARNNKPFVVGDCTVLTESLFESELFGHEKGSFTGSVGEKKGLIEIANGGTLFLDEIGELPLLLQAKLLRVLEDFTFRRVGGTQQLTANVRIVCATNRDLLQMVQEGRFRQDLYYRLAVFPIETPSLQERLEDIPLLATGLLSKIALQMSCTLSISQEAIEQLCQAQFPGNIRELRNVLQYAAAVCNNGIILPEDLPIKRHNAVDAFSIATKRLASLQNSGVSHRQSDISDRRATDNKRVSHGRRATDHGSIMYGRRTTDHEAVSDEYTRAESNVRTATAAKPLPKEAILATQQDTLPDGIVDEVQMRYLAELVKRHKGDKVKVAEHLGISQRTLYRRLSSIKEGIREFIEAEN